MLCYIDDVTHLSPRTQCVTPFSSIFCVNSICSPSVIRFASWEVHVIVSQDRTCISGVRCSHSFARSTIFLHNAATMQIVSVQISNSLYYNPTSSVWKTLNRNWILLRNPIKALSINIDSEEDMELIQTIPLVFQNKDLAVMDQVRESGTKDLSV